MCGIIGIIGKHPVAERILEGLSRLEYRGYDSAGIGHTRWATHGAPSERNAHPHATAKVAVVHNGIIENFEQIKSELLAG